MVFFPESVQGYSNAMGKIEYPIILPSIWDMLVAIDFEQENKLINLKKYFTSGTYDFDKKIKDIEAAGIKGREIPILVNENSFVPMKININFEPYNIDRNQGDNIVKNIVNTPNFNSAYVLNDTLKGKLSSIKASEKKSKTTDLSKYVAPFKTTMIKLKEDGQSLEQVNSGVNYTEYQGSLYYRASPVLYSTSSENLIAEVAGEKNGIAIFRNMQKVGSELNKTIKNGEITNQFKVCGTIKTPEGQSEKLSGSPLGMYGDNYAALYEENKNLKDLKKIFSTTEPGSFVPSAPRGYTSMEALRYLKPNDPIDAIRVRVSGIDKYDDAAKIKIEKIAAKINEETGLHVDVVAGSSNENILISIKGINGSGKMAKVFERWTTLGTAALIVESWSAVGGVLVILFILCGFIFIINRISCSISTRQGEIGTLKAIGWENKHICRVLAVENLLAAILSLTGFKFMYTSYPVSIGMIIVIFLMIVITAVLAGFYPLYRALKISPLDAVLSRDTRTRI